MKTLIVRVVLLAGAASAIALVYGAILVLHLVLTR
jgi:hypothetical protein